MSLLIQSLWSQDSVLPLAKISHLPTPEAPLEWAVNGEGVDPQGKLQCQGGGL